MYIGIHDSIIMTTQNATDTLFSRRDLLPFWVKDILWMIIVTSFVSTFFNGILILAFQDRLGHKTLATSFLDILPTIAVFVSGISAYFLWMGKTWAFDLFVLVTLCEICYIIFDTVNQSSLAHALIHMELFFLIPLIIRLIMVRNNWIGILESVRNP